MVEFRFVEDSDMPNSKKLQFRAWMIRLDASGAMTPLPLPIEWTKWTDIPFIETKGKDEII